MGLGSPLVLISIFVIIRFIPSSLSDTPGLELSFPLLDRLLVGATVALVIFV